MRMWMVTPKIMCDKHLVAEHQELHMFLGLLNERFTMLKGVKAKKSVKRYLKNNLFEPLSLFSRHKELVREMKDRGFKHNTPMNKNEINNNLRYMSDYEKNIKINQILALQDLKHRCDKCRALIKNEGLKK